MKKYVFIFVFLLAAAARVVVCFWQGDCREYKRSTASEGVWARIEAFRQVVLDRTRDVTHELLPSPHSELVLGMVVGVDDFHMLPRFKQGLVDTGVVHVVVVSGFNINIVFSLLTRILGSMYKLRNLLVAIAITFGYAILTGFDPPVIRAWLMVCILHWGKYHGRSISPVPLMLVTAGAMLLIDPRILVSLSFQLSFMATLSLVLFESYVASILARFVSAKSLFISDLSSTLAAQLLVWPLISYNFGRISLISPLVNMLVLWVVPIATLLGGGFIIVGFLNRFLARLLAIPLYFLLDYFVRLVSLFSALGFYGVDIYISLSCLIGYYIAILVGLRLIACR